MSQCPLQQNKDFNGRKVLKVRRTQSRNAPSNRTRISTSKKQGRHSRCRVAMPPPTEQGFQPPQTGVYAADAVAMPPPTEQGFQRRHWILVDEGLESQCPLQQNKDFNMTTPHASTAASRSQCPLQQNKDFNGGIPRDEPGDRVAMPPPTEQGFQRQSGTHGRTWSRSRNAPSNRTRISTSPQRSCLRHSPSQCPLQQNKDFNRLTRRELSDQPRSQCPLQQNKDFNITATMWGAKSGGSQCPLQQNKDFNTSALKGICTLPGRNAPSNRTRISTQTIRASGSRIGRNAPSNRTRISTPPVLQGRSPWSVAMPPPTEQGFQLLIVHDQVYPRGRNASSNRTRIST